MAAASNKSGETKLLETLVRAAEAVGRKLEFVNKVADEPPAKMGAKKVRVYFVSVNT